MKRRRKGLTILIIIIFIVSAIFIYLILPGSKQHRQFIADYKLSFAETAHAKQNSLFTAESIAGLPTAMQKYLSHCGYIGTPMTDFMHLDFPEAEFMLAPNQSFLKVHFEQYNFVARPDRHALIEIRMYGIPLSGKDTILNGEGSMTVVLAKLFTVGYSTGPEMSQAQLVTALADAVLMPTFFLQEYITWRTIDETHAEATVTWNDLTARGIFTFNDAGEIIRFDTKDRYRDQNGHSIQTPWTAEYSDYRETDGFLRPGTLTVYWHMPDCSIYTYFKSDRYTVSYT